MHVEGSKGVLAVILTSLLYKIFHKDQDIRLHQKSIPGGYSGRTFDTRYITPFLKKNNFPAMAESGWLTRSLEQKSPYTLSYKGSIKPSELKASFLKTLDYIEKGAPCGEMLLYILQGLVILRDRNRFDLAKPTSLPIAKIIANLQEHFNFRYKSSGAARLPVLAIYSIYQCLMGEAKRFVGKNLMLLESHTTSDQRSGKIGDIEVRDEKDRVFEGVEVKFGIPITKQMVADTYGKFKTTPVSRYYILSTAGIKEGDEASIGELIAQVEKQHGCQLIVNGIESSLAYYLRLLSDPYEFIEKYVTNLEGDPVIKFEHKQRWNEIVGGSV